MKQKNRSLVILVLFASILLGCEETVEDADGNEFVPFLVENPGLQLV